jgi:hypothetical protein
MKPEITAGIILVIVAFLPTGIRVSLKEDVVSIFLLAPSAQPV